MRPLIQMTGHLGVASASLSGCVVNRVACVVAALLTIGLCAPSAWGQRQRGSAPAVSSPSAAPEPAPAPDLAPALLRTLEAAYLTPEHARELRVFHGVWRRDDLESAASRARAALLVHRFDDPVLAPTADATPVLDRAEAALARGELSNALALLDSLSNPRESSAVRAVRIRAETEATRGRSDLAIAAAAPLIERLLKSPAREMEPAEAVEAVALATLLLRLEGPGGRDQAQRSVESLATALADVRQTDRLFWPARLAEARLLLSRDNAAQAQEAIGEVLALNPRCADAWELLGRMTVNSFSFDMTERIALRLERIAASLSDDETPAISAAAAHLRARAMLRQINGDEAERELAASLSIFPRLVQTRALQAAAAAVRFDLDRARTLLDAQDNDVGGPAPLGYLEVGRALSEARQYDPAAEFLAEVHRRDPHAPEPLIERGLLELQSGRDDEALAALERAFQLDPFNVRADNSLRLARELRTYTTLESDHFIVRHKPGIDAVLAGEMLPVLEEIHAVVTGSQPGGIDHEPDRKTIIELMPDHAWFAVRIAGMPRIHTIAASTGPVIAMEAPRVGPGHKGMYDWVRTLRHEYVHTVTLSRTNNRIPHWFTEAAAVHLELAPRDFQTCVLLAGALNADRLFDLEAINIAFVRPKRPTDRQQAYAQGHWMYEFIIERWGPRAPLELMDRYAIGEREEQAFSSVLGVSRAEFFRQFSAWAREQVVEWGMALPEGVPTVRELLVRDALADPQRLKDIDNHLARLAMAVARGAAGVTSEVDLGGLVAGESGQREAESAWTFNPGSVTQVKVEGWLAEFPEHPDLLELAMDEAVRAAGGEATPAIAPLLERYAAARPVDPKPHRLLAQMYLKAGPNDATAARAAITHLEFLDVREQYSPVFATELARRLALLNDWSSAMTKAERAVSIAPYDARPRELAASIAVRTGDLASAERHIVALTKLEPDRDIHRQRLDALRQRMDAAGS